MKKTLMLLLALALLFAVGTAAAQQVRVEEVLTQFGASSIAYPQLTGMQDEAVQQKINDDIVVASSVANHMVTLFTLTGQQTLNVEYEAYLDANVFSVIISAKGKLPAKRDGHEYTALTYDLATGEKVTLDQLFNDPDEAVSVMEKIAEESLAEELNGYMEYSDISPLPAERFTLDEHGITFWYPSEQLSLTSGYSGACQFWYSELDGLWKAFPNQKGEVGEDKAAIVQTVENGAMPHVPVQLNQSINEAAQQYRLLREPDEFPGGRYFVMEHPSLRGILLISDSIRADYEESVVEGIQLRRGDLHGLKVGRTQRREWHELLGTPDENFAMSQSMAYDYGLCEGNCDIYRFGENELRLYADTQDILFAIQICK